MPVITPVAFWLPIVLGIVMMGAGGVNFVGPASVRASFERWGYPSGFHRVTGGLEVAIGLLLMVPLTSRVGAIGSAIVLLGAMATLVRVRDWGHLPGAVILTAAAIAIAVIG